MCTNQILFCEEQFLIFRPFVVVSIDVMRILLKFICGNYKMHDGQSSQCQLKKQVTLSNVREMTGGKDVWLLPRFHRFLSAEKIKHLSSIHLLFHSFVTHTVLHKALTLSWYAFCKVGYAPKSHYAITPEFPTLTPTWCRRCANLVNTIRIKYVMTHCQANC